MRGDPFRFARALALWLGTVVVLTAASLGGSVGGAGAAPIREPTPPAGSGSGGGTGSGPGGGEAASRTGPATPGTVVTTVTNAQLTQISGIAATDKGFLVVEARDVDAVKLYTVDTAGKVTAKTYTTANPLNPQDLAVASDGTIWVADIGDAEGNRPHVAFHVIAPAGSAAVPNRVVYPDGAKTASAFFLDGDGAPVILANVSGKPGATLYKPTKALVPNSTTGLPELAKVGEFVPDKTGTANPTAESTVTGAARSADGTKVVIRTLSDAYEWDVPSGDAVKAIAAGKPRVTPLPDEPQGEAIAYTADGKYVTVGFKPAGATDNAKILSYSPFVPPPAPTGGDDQAGPAQAPPSTTEGLLSKLSFSELTRIIAAVGAVGLVLAVAGIVGIRRARRRRRDEEEQDAFDDGHDSRYEERPRRGRAGAGRAPGGRQDDRDRGYGSLDPQYDDQYGGSGGYAGGDYQSGGYAGTGYAGAASGAASGAGYGANGYQADDYAGAGYGQPQQYGADGYGPQGHGAQGHGAHGYGAPGAGYGGSPVGPTDTGGYDPPPGSGGGYGGGSSAPPGYGLPPGYGPPPGYGAAPAGYGPPGDYGAPAGHDGGYGQQPYGQPAFGQPPADPPAFGQPQYGGQYGEHQYGDPGGGQQYGAQPYGAGQPTQPYGDHPPPGGQPPSGGYGYDEFDPLQDPRRR